MAKKAQLTIFVLIALILVISFSFVYYARSLTASSRSQQALITEITQPVNIKIIRHEIEDKIRNIFLERLQEIALKGGAVLNSDGTIYNSYCLSTGISEGIGCGIKWPQNVGITDYNSYTDLAGSYNGRYIHPPSPSSSYGWSSLIPGGLNVRSSSPTPSLSRQISSYMEEKIPTEIGTISKQELRGYKLIADGTPDVNIYFNNKDIFVEVYYNVTLEKETVKASFRKFNFVVDYNFTEVYTMLKKMVSKDVGNLSYDLKSEPSLLFSSYPFYDIITYEDENFYINGEKFKFSFLRENRAPDANTVYITRSGQPVDDSNFVLYSDGGQLTLNCPNYDDYILGGPDSVNGVVFADPDEDDKLVPLTYTTQSEGWYETGRTPIENLDIGCSQSVVDDFEYGPAGGDFNGWPCENTRNIGEGSVGDSLIITIRDGNLYDTRNYSNIVKCDPAESCCDSNGLWKVGQQCDIPYFDCNGVSRKKLCDYKGECVESSQT